jgi:GxxExxY protein
MNQKRSLQFITRMKRLFRDADLLFDHKVIVEIKALTKLEDVHLAQAINYLEAFNLEVGLLINFGSKSLEFKKIIHPSLLKNKSIKSR